MKLIARRLRIKYLAVVLLSLIATPSFGESASCAYSKGTFHWEVFAMGGPSGATKDYMLPYGNIKHPEYGGNGSVHSGSANRAANKWNGGVYPDPPNSPKWGYMMPYDATEVIRDGVTWRRGAHRQTVTVSGSCIVGGTCRVNLEYYEVCKVEANQAPIANNGSLSLKEDTSGSISLSATDSDGDALTFNILSQPPTAHGVVSFSGNRATFTPKPNWNGTTSFTYRANDGKANSNTATVTVTVTPVNDTPSVANATLAIDEDTVGTLTLGVTDVDLQFEGDSHTWSIVTAPNAAHGTASITGNKLTFTPAKDWNGTTTLTYRATDSKSATSNTATITITVRPVNDAPVASNGTLTVAEDTSGTVTLVATDVEGDSLTYSVVTQPNAAHGTVTISGNKATFTPKPNWNGTTSFTYRANDGTVNSNTATVTVTVTPVNDAPVGMTPLTIRTIEGRTVEVKVTVLPN